MKNPKFIGTIQVWDAENEFNVFIYHDVANNDIILRKITGEEVRIATSINFHTPKVKLSKVTG